MPKPGRELIKFTAPKYSATSQISQCSWQLTFYKWFQACQFFVTPDGISSPTTSLHRTTGAFMFLQFTVTSNNTAELPFSPSFSLNDLQRHAKSISTYLKPLQMHFEFCNFFNLTSDPARWVIAFKTISWYGKTISYQGIVFGLIRTSSIQYRYVRPPGPIFNKIFVRCSACARTIRPSWTPFRLGPNFWNATTSRPLGVPSLQSVMKSWPGFPRGYLRETISGAAKQL